MEPRQGRQGPHDFMASACGNAPTKTKKKRKRRAPENSADAAAARVMSAAEALNKAIEVAVDTWGLNLKMSVSTVVDQHQKETPSVSIDALTKDFMPF
jgi:hypothetical protein